MSGAVLVGTLSHRSQVPEKVKAYFASPEPKTITGAFLPRIGWISYSGLVSFSKLLRLRAAGYTDVAIACSGRVADFTLGELLSKVQS